MEKMNFMCNAMIDDGATTAYIRADLIMQLGLTIIDSESKNFIVAEHQSGADIIAGREMLRKAGNRAVWIGTTDHVVE